MNRYQRTAFALVFASAITAACAAEPSSFRASGNEPGWSLQKNAEGITFHTLDGKSAVVSPLPEVQKHDGIEVYLSTSADGPVLLVIADRICVDTMSGMPHPNVVLVQVGGRKYSGCGGEPANLLMGEWMVERFAEKPLVKDSEASLNFQADGQLSGGASCNRFFGQYALSGEGLTVKTGGMSMMACPEPIMDQEQRFLKFLERISRFDIGPGGTLILHAGDQSMVAHRKG
jgi:heat shock protein HslJ